MDGEDSIKILLGDPKKAIVRLAVPLILSLLVSQANVLADRAWCAGLGDDVMAAVAVVTPIYMTLVGLGSGLGVGASAVISKMIGAGRREDSLSASAQAIIFALAFGIVLTPILLVSQSTLLSIIGSANVLDLTLAYIMPYTIFTVVIIFNGVIGGILNGQGATRFSMIMMTVQAASNIILDPIFIYSLGWGIQGAAIATVISTILSLLVGIMYLRSNRTYLDISRGNIRYHKDNMHALMRAGIPQMIEYAIMWSMNAVLNYIVLMNPGGSHALTIYSTPDNLMDLIVIPAMAIGSALVPVASSALGQADLSRMKKSFRYALTLGLSCVLILAILVELFPEQALFIFSYSGEMLLNRPEMVAVLRIMCGYVMFFSFTPLCSGYLQALGHPNRSVIMALWRNAVLITFFWFAMPYSVNEIAWALVFGHMVGAASIFTVTMITQRQVSKKMSEQPIDVSE